MARVTGRFQVNGSALGLWGRRFTSAQADRIASQVLEVAKRNCPVRSGRLRNSGKVDGVTSRGMQAEGTVSFTAPYAVFVHEGTRPHVIRPRYARALRFEMDGRTVFAAKVHHPGTAPNPFLANAVWQVRRSTAWASPYYRDAGSGRFAKPAVFTD